MPAALKFDFTLGGTSRGERREPDSPMRILVLGSFSGRCRDAREVRQGSAQRIDPDNFDRVLAHFAPEADVPAGDVQWKLAFETLDQFHPDAVMARMELFRPLRELRKRLQDPAAFAAAAAEMRERGEVATSIDAGKVQGTATRPADDDTRTLDRLLGRKGTSADSAPARAAGGQESSAHAGLQALLRSVVAPHVVAPSAPFQQQYIAALDLATGEQMRAVLHHPSFQALESVWRGIRWLMDALDPDGAISLELADVAQEELRADLERAGTRLQDTGLHRLLESPHDPDPWSLIVGLYSFDAEEPDVNMLAALGALAAHHRAPFIAGASPGIVGCPSFAEAPDPARWTASNGTAQRWRALRTASFARWIGLAMPRVLLRLPYGSRTETIESFQFEELPDGAHQLLSWGNPALACALLLGRSFREEGWSMTAGSQLQIDDLPSFTVQRAGEKRLQPCAEAMLGERASQTILERGIMPILSFGNRNAVRLMRMQSIADPPAPLAGPWR